MVILNELFIKEASMARPTKKDGVIAHFGAPRRLEDQGDASFSMKKFAEITYLRKTLQVPVDYVHEKQLDRHMPRTRLGSKNYIDPLVVRAALVSPTDILMPGARYDVRFYALQGKTTSLECIKFLRSERSLQVGIQGLSLFYGLLEGGFPPDRWVIAFDDRGYLFSDDGGSCRVPMLLHPLVGSSSLSLGHFDFPWHNKHVLLTARRIE